MSTHVQKVVYIMASQFADQLREEVEEFKRAQRAQMADLAEYVRAMGESQRVQAEVAVLFSKRDPESLDKQRVVKMALGLE
jgi:hypothetical protein